MERRLSRKEIAQIVKMRGLGYSQSDIAQVIGISQSGVQYQLSKLRRRAEEEDEDDLFLEMLVAAGIGVAAGIILAKLLGDD